MKIFKREKIEILTNSIDENKYIAEYLIEKNLGEIEIKITDLLTEKTYSKIEIKTGNFDYNEFQQYIDDKYDEQLFY